MRNIVKYNFDKKFGFNTVDVNKINENVFEENSVNNSSAVCASGSGIENNFKFNIKNNKFNNWLEAEYVSSFQASGASNSSGEQYTLNKSEVKNSDNNQFNYATSLKEEDVNNWEALQKAIKDMGLRETMCKGVYCQLHNPDMPKGDYSHQRHFVWNDSTQEMVELHEVYFIGESGQQAKDLDGYEEIQAYAQGFHFTETDGIYEKKGKNYKYNVETSEFEEVVEDTRTGLEKLWDKYLTDENDKEVSTNTILPFLSDLRAVLMSKEYNYTEEQYNELIQKAVQQCSTNVIKRGGQISILLNFKELVSTVKNLIENIEEPEKSSVDKILDKYDTDEYDKDVEGIETVATLKEILDELTPVLVTEYNMSQDDIQKLVQDAVKSSSKSNLTGPTINVRTFVNTLKELIANYEPSVPEEPEEPVDNRTDLEKFLDRMESDEFNKTVSKEEALSYINELKDLLMAEFSEKRGYSEEYSNFMFDFIKNYMNIGEEVNLKDVLNEFYNNVQKLTEKSDLISYLTWDEESYCIVCPWDAGIEVDFLKDIIYKNLPDGVDEQTYVKTLFNKLNLYVDNTNKNSFISFYKMKLLSTGNDNSWFDEFHTMVCCYSKNYDYVNATQINAKNLFKDTDSISVKDLFNSNFILNKDAGLMKFSEYFDKTVVKFNLQGSKYDQEDLLRAIVVIMNRRAGVQNTVPAALQRETIEKLNEQDIFAIIDEIIESDELKHEYYCGVDGNIDDFGQGQVGDCWLLASLISISSSEQGRQILKDSIKVNNDGSVTVTFKGLGVSTTVTAESLMEARGHYSNGDNDVLAIELAVEQLIRDNIIIGDYTNGGRSEYMIEILTGMKGQSNFSYDPYNSSDLVSAFRSGDVILTVDGKSGEGNINITTIDGEQLSFPRRHAYGVVDLTEDTITIVNPWYSDKKYTISLVEFYRSSFALNVNLNPELAKIDLEDTDNFTIDGKEYNFDTILNSEETIFSRLIPDFIPSDDMFQLIRTIMAGRVHYDFTCISNKIETIIKSMANSIHTNVFSKSKVNSAVASTQQYFEQLFNEYNPYVLAELEDENKDINEILEGHSFLYETTDNESALNGSAFEGQTSETGLYFAHNTNDDTWYVQIDIKAVLEKFLSFLK